MSILLSIPIMSISTEDFYNYLYWDHRIYDLRSKDDYIISHICRSYNINPSPIISVDSLTKLDREIDDDYGRAEHPSEVLIYTNNKTHHDYKFQLEILNTLLSYLSSSINPSNKLLKQVHILTDGYESFHSTFPFLCSDSIYYNECSQLVWPSHIKSNLYLGSAMCRNSTVISMLKITHIMSLSDYPEKKLESSNTKTLHLQISDSSSAKLLPVFSSAVTWISKAINDDKGIVLVHCDQGVSRSASVIIAYLLHSDANMSTVDAAFNLVKTKRSIIRPNESFMQQLQQYLNSISMKNVNMKTQKQDFDEC